MPNREKVISGLQRCRLMNKVNCDKCPYDYNGRGDGKSECTAELADDALVLLKEQNARIQKYEYVFDFLGIGFRQWATKILDGEAEAICETDEHEHKTVVTFKLI